MVKTTIIVDDEVWKDFSVIVIRKQGERKKNAVINELIKKYINKYRDALYGDKTHGT